MTGRWSYLMTRSHLPSMPSAHKQQQAAPMILLNKLESAAAQITVWHKIAFSRNL
nr:MAG TPA: hypothetical protein [Caudoviricetes sp.]